MENEENVTAGGGPDIGDFDMESAVESMSEGIGKSLGFDAPEEDTTADDTTASTTAAPAEPAQPTAPAEPAKPTASAPRTWRAEAAAEYATLSPTVQAEIAKREEDMFKGIEQYRGMANIGKQYSDVIKPYEQVLRQLGANPVEQVKGLMQSHYTLAFGSPQEKLGLFQRIAKDYGIDLGQVQDQVQYTDPQVQTLREELAQLRSSHQQLAQAETTRTQAQLNGMVRDFKADPANIHFDEVSKDMVQLLQSGAEPDLKSAYQTAIWRNPVTRAKEIERVNSEKAAEVAAKAKEEAAKAKKAMAGSVRSSARQGSAATPTGSMEDTMRETLERLRSA